MRKPTDAEIARVRAAIAYVHAADCARGKVEPGPCVSCPRGTPVLLSIRHLDEFPRDARGVRQILHDAACMSGCGPEDDSHANSTQSKTAATLRKFHAAEGGGQR